jgi:Xaa-Pro aminopeptidase
MDLISEIRRDPIAKELAFARAEYAERVAKVQRRMADAGLDLLLISNTGNLGYLTGYDTSMPPGYTVGILPVDGEVGLHCSELEATCALLFSTIEDFAVFHWYDAQDTGTHLGEILRERGYDGKRIGLEMGYAETFASGAFHTRSYLTLVDLLPEATFVDATNLVLDVRIVKSRTSSHTCARPGSYRASGSRPPSARRPRAGSTTTVSPPPTRP